MKTILVQTIFLTMSNLKSRYRNTIAGFIWVILNPLIMYGVQSLVFKKFLNLQIPNYYIFLASGLLPWIFLVQSLQMCTPLFHNSRDILRTYPIKPIVILAAQILDNLVNFTFALLLLLVPLYCFYVEVSWGILLLPITIFLFVFGIFSFCWILACVNIFFRDTKFIMDFVLSIAFWLTPVFYSIDNIPHQFRWIVSINPAYYFIDFFRSNIIDFNFSTYLIKGSWVLALDLLFLVLAYFYWKFKKNKFYLYL